MLILILLLCTFDLVLILLFQIEKNNKLVSTFDTNLLILLTRKVGKKINFVAFRFVGRLVLRTKM